MSTTWVRWQVLYNFNIQNALAGRMAVLFLPEAQLFWAILLVLLVQRIIWDTIFSFNFVVCFVLFFSATCGMIGEYLSLFLYLNAGSLCKTFGLFSTSFFHNLYQSFPPGRGNGYKTRNESRTEVQGCLSECLMVKQSCLPVIVTSKKL